MRATLAFSCRKAAQVTCSQRMTSHALSSTAVQHRVSSMDSAGSSRNASSHSATSSTIPTRNLSEPASKAKAGLRPKEMRGATTAAKGQRLSLAAPLLFAAAAHASVAPAMETTQLTLVAGKARLFRSGNPLIFSGALRNPAEAVPAGAVVDVCDGKGSLIGWGVYNPSSMYRVRMFVHASDPPQLLAHRCMRTLLSHRLRESAATRRACNLPSAETTAYRLVNGEGDRLSGLLVDVFARKAVVVSAALWVEMHRDVISAALLELPDVDEVVWRKADARLKADGWVEEGGAGGTAEVDDNEAEEQEEEAVDGAKAGSGSEGTDDTGSLTVLEHGLKFIVNPTLGQKSGFYCDQRENRRALAALCSERRVLDLFCYSGGFSLAAAAAGAVECVGVDSSAAAVALARSNAEINELPNCRFEQADVLEFLRGNKAKDFDVVICDPPKLAPSVKHLVRATPRYRKLNGLAMRALKPGGLLLTCTCSAAMAQSGNFVSLVQEAAQAERRTLTLLRTSSAADDHVLHPSFPEGDYLKALLFVVH